MTEEKQNLVDTIETSELSIEVIEDQAQSKRERIRQRQQSANELLARLSVEYPDIFPKAGQGRPVPLAIGMHKLLQPIVAEWGYNSMVLRTAMFNYTRQLRYQNALLFAPFRINLDGTQAEEVTEEQKEAAKGEVVKIESWLAKNRPEKAQRLSEKRAQFAEKKQQNRASKPKQHSKPQNNQKSKPVVKKDVQLPQEERSEQKVSAQNIDEKMQNLLSKFNQH